MSRILIFVRNNSEFVKIGLTIFAAVFVLIQYFERLQSSREVRALEYVYRAHSAELLPARVSAEIFAIEPPLASVTQNLYRADDAERCGKYSPVTLCPPHDDALGSQKNFFKTLNTPTAMDFGEYDFKAARTESRRAFRLDVHSLASFYSALATCAISENCDRRILCQTFSGEVYAFFTRYYGYLESLEAEWNIRRLFFIKQFENVCNNPDYRLKGQNLLQRESLVERFTRFMEMVGLR